LLECLQQPWLNHHDIWQIADSGACCLGTAVPGSTTLAQDPEAAAAAAEGVRTDEADAGVAPQADTSGIIIIRPSPFPLDRPVNPPIAAPVYPNPACSGESSSSPPAFEKLATGELMTCIVKQHGNVSTEKLVNCI
jgi:hypothetical protein